EAATGYDTFGLPTTVKDLGDTVVGADDTCTSTSYARNVPFYLINYPVQTVTTDCAASPGDGDYLAGAQTFYDGATNTTTAPTVGLPTKTTVLASVAGGELTWRQAGRADYDGNGRVVAALDALDRKSATGYIPAAGGPLTQTVTTNPLGWTTSTTLDPVKAAPTS